MKTLLSVATATLLTMALTATQAQEKQQEVGERAASQEASQEKMEMSRASKIIGTDVKNAKGENLGEIKDVVLNPQDGKVVYAVVSFGGVMGMGNKLFAVPWSVLRRHGDKDYYLLDMDKDTLKKAPGFDKKRWPDSSNKWEQQREQINQFYRVNP
jgi:sporulation protein YlmC with PRC-barrel domain